MAHSVGLLKKQKFDMIGKDWYLQRFDAAPFFIMAIGETEFFREQRKFAGGEFTERVIIFQDKTCDWHIAKSDIARVSELIFRQSFKLQKITNAKIIKYLNDMQKQNQLIKINLPGLTGKKWYHQQGDACLFLIQTLGGPYMTKEKRKQEMFYKHLFMFFQDKIGNWYHDTDDLKFIAGRSIKKSAQGAISKSLMKKWAKDEAKFFIESKKLDKINWSKLSDKQLKKLFTSYMVAYFKAVSSSSIIDGFALGTDETVQKEITSYLDSIGKGADKNRYFTILTAPVTQSFINEAELSLLRVAQLIGKDSAYKNILIKSLDSAINQLEKFTKIKKALSNHTKKYFWVKNNYYSAPILTEKDFLEEIRGILVGNVDLSKEINRILGTPKKHRLEKQKLIKELSLPKYIKILLTISEDFTYWQDERKKKTFWMDHYGTLFLKEFSRRFGFVVDDLKYFVHDELIGLFGGKSVVSKSEATSRRQACLYYQKGDKYEVISGPEAEKLKKELFDAKQSKMVNDFRGLPASRGKVRGKVKIILSVNEIDRVQKGDVLVAVMTRPDYVPAIKKAAAIITDEGGITCHAAIISRELGIPCVIGTKIATRVLKDGDEVDVNANHGVVTIVKRA
ncbi:MAG: PEP-utilizing enzyme [Candidatus Magasanikbacteria bacterium]